MTFSDEIVKTGTLIIPLLDIGIDGVTAKICNGNQAVEIYDDLYEPRLLRMSSISRTLSSLISGNRPANFTIDIDVNNWVLTAIDPNKIYNRDVNVKIFANTATQQFMIGSISRFSYENGLTVLSLGVTDPSSAYFDEQNKWWSTLTREEWAGLEDEYVNAPAPLTIGILDSRGSGYKGTVKAIKLSDVLYMVSGHACKGVPAVFDAGEPVTGGYTVYLDYAWSKGINGLATIIEFIEKPSGDVTCDVLGLTDDLTKEGNLITNVVDVIEVLRKEVFGLPDSKVNTTQMALAKEFATRYHLRVAGQVISELEPMDIMYQIVASVSLYIGWDSESKLNLWYTEPPIDTSNSEKVNERHDIVEGSVSVTIPVNTICNDLRIQFLRNWAAGSYDGDISDEVSGSQTSFNKTYKRILSLPWCNEHLVAWAVKELALLDLGYGHLTVSWADTLRRADVLELGDAIKLSHRNGPSTSGGWDDLECLITGIGLDINKGRISYEAKRITDMTVGELGSSYVLGGALPDTVL